MIENEVIKAVKAFFTRKSRAEWRQEREPIVALHTIYREPSMQVTAYRLLWLPEDDPIAFVWS